MDDAPKVSAGRAHTFAPIRTHAMSPTQIQASGLAGMMPCKEGSAQAMGRIQGLCGMAENFMMQRQGDSSMAEQPTGAGESHRAGQGR